MWPVTAACGVLCNLIAGDQGGDQGGGQAVTAHSTSHINQHKPGPGPAKINRSDSVWTLLHSITATSLLYSAADGRGSWDYFATFIGTKN